ncbi:hypothetical protein Ddye_029184 [Dipteronia dyeriana]|uniref:Uncharacterized protein n=1 Tax=Dipteronia dyeriana TaxID=168575 RepID=A0AAD9TEP2_9ROSI|nr:hypothetical protein Ddye_029184 [Dipteronia dyeriana]
MDRRTFVVLYELLLDTMRLETNGLVSVEEQMKSEKGLRDMLFTFVFQKWKGLASDSIVLRDTLFRPTGLKVPTGMDARGCSQTNEQEGRGNR